MNHRLRVGLVTSCIDNRPARGTALVARRFLERLDRASGDFDFTLIHHPDGSDLRCLTTDHVHNASNEVQCGYRIIRGILPQT